VHKRYIKVFDDEINKDQLGSLPFDDLFKFITEYEERESLESILAKDADMLDQILLLREYEWQGSKEAKLWLEGSPNDASPRHVDRLKTEEAKKLGQSMMERNPSDWWHGLSTNTNR
jgi:putative hydrolase of HD superfamily